MIRTSDALDKFAPAFRAAQGDMTGVHKDRVNPHFKNRYATFESVCDTIRPVLGTHGLSWSQHPGPFDEGCIAITTRIMHDSGQWLESTFQMPVAKQDPQGTGSAISYALRYTLMAIMGLPPTDDDDGEAAMPKPAAKPVAKPKAQSRDLYSELEAEIRACKSVDEIRRWWKDSSARRGQLNPGFHDNLLSEAEDHKARLVTMAGEKPFVNVLAAG